MAIATVAEVNWNGTIDNTNKIGISDTLDNLSADLWDDNSVYVTAFNDYTAKFTRNTNSYPVTTSKTDQCPWYLLGGTGYSNTEHNSNSYYYCSALLAVPSGFNFNTWNNGTGGMIRNTANNIRVITKLSIEKNNIAVSLNVHTSGEVTGHTYLVNESLENTTATGSFDYDGERYKIVLADVMKSEDDYFLTIPPAYMGNVYDRSNGEGVMGCWAYHALHSKMFSICPEIFDEADKTISINGSGYYNINTWYHHPFPAIDEDENLQMFGNYTHDPWHVSITGNVHYNLLCVSRYGLYFTYNNTDYKPVISQGVVTGYTTDMTTESDIDNWTDISGHNISPTPPPPVPPNPDEDEDTAISTNGAPFGTGLAHYYVTTVDSLTLQHISEAMGTWDIDATKKDLYRNLISCKLIKPPAGIPSTSGVFTIYGVKPQYNGADITISEVTGNPSITFGPYTIDRKFYDFRDYAPYSKCEIFAPYCGWTALPSHCIGRSVYVDYFTDVIAGTVKAVIRCGNNVVAEAAGVMAVDIPFAADNVGAKVAAATTGMLSYGQGALQASVGIGQAVASKGKAGIKNITSGLASVIGAYNQMAMVNNENWTEINGKSGDGCALAGIDTIIIKITRPKYGSYEAPYYVPAEYPHTVGFVAMKKATVGSCTGLIVCDNVDTSGISGATDRERQLIKEYLESGVIVHHPE